MSKPLDLNKLIAESTADDDSMVSRVVLRDVATFDSTGVEFIDLQRVNFIYGGNGCGKTTFLYLLLPRQFVRLHPCSFWLRK